MNKVYLVILDWACSGDMDYEIEVYTTLEKAKERLKQRANIEKETSWIRDIELEDFENFEERDNYFDACYYDDRTTIYILEKEIN